MIAYIDDIVGRLMHALVETGVEDKTTVLFTSDHGDMIGERGMWFKKTLFESAIHVPLIVHAPGRFGPSRVAAPVSLIDILPTLNEIAGGSAQDYPVAIDGASLLPLLEGASTAHRDVIAEHIDGATLAPRIMLRRGRWKLVHSRAYPPMMFDLIADPLELTNLASGSEHQDVLAEMTSIIETSYDLDALPDQVVASQCTRRFIDGALARGQPRPWDFRAQPQIDPWFDKSALSL